VSPPDPIEKAVCKACATGCFAGWQVTNIGESNEFWCVYEPSDVPRRDAGLKIHLSASISSASEILTRTIPILARMGIAFKHTATLEHLAFLSSGCAGVSQVGKFLTAYPPDDKTALELAHSLHAVTNDLKGPRIPSEPSLFPNSLVHYRYGGFSMHWLQLRTGRIVPARAGVSGLEADVRAEPAPVSLALESSFGDKTAARPQYDFRTLRDRYVRIQQLHRGPKGSTWLGFQKGAPESELHVIKEAFAHVMEGTDGLDARERLSREADCLTRLEATGVTPILIDYWEEEHSSFLVYRLVEGPTFASVLGALAAEGLRPPVDLLRQWILALCATLSQLHRFGHVFGDLKPANLVFTGHWFHLIDLELAGVPTSHPSGNLGTHGYCSPQQSDSLSGRSCLDDIYALGATMLAAATLTDASLLPSPLSVAQLERSRDSTNPIYWTIEHCLAPEPSERPQSADAVAKYISQLRAPVSDVSSHGPLTSSAFLRHARIIGDALLRDATQEDDQAYWISKHPTVGGHPGRDLYAGSAGTALFLCALYEATEKSCYLDMALKCGRWLVSTEPFISRQAEMPGLYFGDCGIALLYLKLYLLTGEDDWLSRAAFVSEQVSKMPRNSPDLMLGSAGIGLFQLALWYASRDQAALSRALDEGCALLETRTMNRPTWVIPPGYESLSGKEYIGFSHGSAGIGYFLAECCLARYDSAIERSCSEVADWIISLGQPSLEDRTGLTWPATADGLAPYGAYWCHGSAGVARFLLKAYDLSGHAAHLQAAKRAGRMVALGLQWSGTTQCHGLAGNLEVLIDIWQRLSTDDFLIAARLLGENLATYRTELGWPSEHPLVVSPDLMVGQAGVGAAFIRLSNPKLPHLISTNAFAAHCSRNVFA
jgi:hypothetical protein